MIPTQDPTPWRHTEMQGKRGGTLRTALHDPAVVLPCNARLLLRTSTRHAVVNETRTHHIADILEISPTRQHALRFSMMPNEAVQRIPLPTTPSQQDRAPTPSSLLEAYHGAGLSGRKSPSCSAIRLPIPGCNPCPPLTHFRPQTTDRR